MNLWLTSSSPAGRERERGNFRHENTSTGAMFLSRFPRSSPGNFGGGYHGNRWIPGTTLLPAEPPLPPPPSLPPSCPHVHWGERAETFCLFEQFPLDFWRNALQLRWLKQIPIRCVLGFFFFLSMRKPVSFNLLQTFCYSSHDPQSCCWHKASWQDECALFKSVKSDWLWLQTLFLFFLF